MFEIHGQVKNGRLTFHPTSEELYMRVLSDLEGKSVILRLYRKGPAKTTKQAGAHFGLAVAMIRERMIEMGWAVCGVAPNKEMVHEILLRACGGVGEMGESLRFSQMTIDQASKFFENVRDWAASELNLVIPDPDPEWKKRKRNLSHADENSVDG